MGFIRKATSLSTGGLVNFRSPEERIAHSMKINAKANKMSAQAQAELAREQAALLRAEREGK